MSFCASRQAVHSIYQLIHIYDGFRLINPVLIIVHLRSVFKYHISIPQLFLYYLFKDILNLFTYFINSFTYSFHMLIHIFIHILIHVLISYTYSHIHSRILIHVYSFINTHSRIHSRILIHVYSFINTHSRILIHVYSFINTHS